MFGLKGLKKEDGNFEEATIDIKTKLPEMPDVNVTTEEVKKSKKEVSNPPPLTWKEAKALKRSRYEKEIKDNPRFKNMYVLKNKRTDQIVQIRAATPIHACNIIGWKPNRVKVLVKTAISESSDPSQADNVEIKEVKREAPPETTSLT